MLLIVRHGEAKSQEEDPQRGLSDRGRIEVAAVARALRALKPEVATIWHSGKPRAEQTARLLADALGAGKRVQPHSGLDPGSPAARTAVELRDPAEDLAIVGHLPHLGRLLGLLLIGKEEPVLFQLPPAGVVCLERTESFWQVLWFLTPETCLA